MNRNIKILMHTHWDREWYFTKDETKVLLRNHMQEVMGFLEENPDHTYILDGQSIMIDDYLELEPDAESRMKNLIENRQLRVGPWYTQTDLLLVHGESVYRNLYYGIKRAHDFGKPMLVGYAPDTFGHSSQMPQIYSQFGINSTFFWRGFSELKAEKSDFTWEGIDGTRIFGGNLSTGYQGAKYLEEDRPQLKARIRKLMAVLDKYSAGTGRLVMNGHDQMPIQSNIVDIVRKLKEIYPEDHIEVSDFEGYIDTLKGLDLEVVRGELTHSKHSRIHRTIGSTRMDIKLLNSEIEHKLYNSLEPLAVIGADAGIPYPHGVIENILKTLFGVHAHDSLGGCNSDKVNRDIKQRLMNAREMIDTQIELHLRLITLAKRDEKNVIAIVNTLPEYRKDEYLEVEMITRSCGFDIVDEAGRKLKFTILKQSEADAGLIDRQVAARLLDLSVYKSVILLQVDGIDGLSTRYFKVIENGEYNAVEKVSENSISNQWGELFLSDNSLNYRDLRTGQLRKNVLFIENSGDAGDSYDYSPPVHDRILDTAQSGRISAEKVSGKGFEELRVSWTMNVPSDMAGRLNGTDDTLAAFTASFRLYDNDPKVYSELKHVNKVKDSRYRLVFSTGIETDMAHVDGFLSAHDKPVYMTEELAVWEKEQWAEKPISVETFQSFVHLAKDNRNAYLFTDGLKEYEVLEDRIHLTLFRCFSHLGKRNLVNRPGRPSGIEIETPDNQLTDVEFSFRFAFSFNLNEVNASRESKKFLSPLIGYQRKEFNRFNINARKELKVTEGHLNMELGKATVSAVKLTEKTGDVFIRLFNPENIDISVVLPDGSYRASAMEEKLESVENAVLRPQEIINIIVSN